ncbi:MAG: hypothetical protein ACXWR1_01275 [Bdellovibrionota bacterium]
MNHFRKILVLAFFFGGTSAALACQCTVPCVTMGTGPDYFGLIDFGKILNHTYCSCPSGIDATNAKGCENTPPDTATDTATTTQTDVTAPVADLKAAIEAQNQAVTKTINGVGNSESGQQTSSLKSADEVNALGANQAATAGALFCAAGANAQAENTPDAPALYANCDQYFSSANAIKGSHPGGFTPVSDTVDSAAAQETLQGFEKNFGISGSNYLERMLGPGGGKAALRDMVSEKISAEKLAEAFDAAKAANPSSVSDPNKFAVDLGGGAKKNGSLRDALKKKIAEIDAKNGAPLARENNSRTPASKDDDLGGLTPGDLGLASQDQGTRELTIFDVVHLKYAERSRSLRTRGRR